MEVGSRTCTKVCASESYKTEKRGKQELFCTDDMCTGFYVRANGAKQCCDGGCPESAPFQYLETRECVALCNTSAYSVKDDGGYQCVSECQNLYIEDTARNMRQCVDECENYSYKGRCVASCSGFVNGTQCVDFCKYYVEAGGVRVCQAACKVRMDGDPPYRCVDSCSSG